MNKFLLGFMLLVFVFTGSSCEILGEVFTVPSWAQGKWSLNKTIPALAATITSKEFIPSPLSQLIPGIEKKTVTWVSSDSVHFDIIEVKQINSGEITVGIAGVTQTLYKFY